MYFLSMMLLTVVLLALKMTGYAATLAWWVVFAPLMVMPAVVFMTFFCVGFGAAFSDVRRQRRLKREQRELEMRRARQEVEAQARQAHVQVNLHVDTSQMVESIDGLQKQLKDVVAQNKAAGTRIL